MAALQVEPVQWSAKRQRKVLNAALVSPITTEMIRAADFAVANGYSGSLSRCVRAWPRWSLLQPCFVVRGGLSTSVLPCMTPHSFMIVDSSLRQMELSFCLRCGKSVRWLPRISQTFVGATRRGCSSRGCGRSSARSAGSPGRR